MTRNVKISIGMVAAALLVAVVVARIGGDDEAAQATAGDSRSERLVRPDSQRLERAG